MLAGLLMVAAACGGDKPASDAEVGVEVPREVELAPSTMTQPQLQDVPAPAAAPAPVRQPTATRPPAKAAPTQAAPPTVAPPAAAPPTVAVLPAAAPGVIPAGTEFAVRSTAKLCTNTHAVGDRVVATIAEAVTGLDGATIPSGATATLQVTESQAGENDQSKVSLGFKVISVAFGGQSYEVVGAEVTSAPVEKVRRQSTGDQAKKVAAGAAIGAAVGQIIGKNTKSTVVGGAIGAIGGAAAASGTADYDGCVAENARMAVKLAQPLRLVAKQ